VEFACLAFVARRNFLVRPRTMRDGAFQQSTIFEVICEDRFQEIQIRNRFGIFQNGLNYMQTPEACLKASGAGMETKCVFSLLVVASWFISLGSTRLGSSRRGRSLVSSAAARRRRRRCSHAVTR